MQELRSYTAVISRTLLDLDSTGTHVCTYIYVFKCGKMAQRVKYQTGVHTQSKLSGIHL